MKRRWQRRRAFDVDLASAHHVRKRPDGRHECCEMSGRRWAAHVAPTLLASNAEQARRPNSSACDPRHRSDRCILGDGSPTCKLQLGNASKKRNVRDVGSKICVAESRGCLWNPVGRISCISAKRSR